jgi:hypothetical protein
MTNLKEMLGYENPRRQEYVELIKRVEQVQHSIGGDDLTQTWAEIWKGIIRDEESRKILVERLGGTTLVDLACGQSGTGSGLTSFYQELYVLDLAKATGVARYVGVDKYLNGINVATVARIHLRVAKKGIEERRLLYGKFFKTGLNRDLVEDPGFRELVDLEAHYAPMRVSLSRGDMLEFISQLHGPVNYIINGVDEAVLGGSLWLYGDSDRYVSAVADEIARTTKPGGVVLINQCHFGPFLLERGFSRVKVPTSSYELEGRLLEKM